MKVSQIWKEKRKARKVEVFKVEGINNKKRSSDKIRQRGLGEIPGK